MSQFNKLFLILFLTISAQLLTAQASAGYLGLRVQNLPAHVSAHMPENITKDIVQNQGVIVDWLEDISPAADEGIHLYDVLYRYNDQAITSPSAFMQTIQQTQAGQKATIKLIRQGEEISLEVTITDAPNGIKMTPAPKQTTLAHIAPPPTPKKTQSVQRINRQAPQNRRLNIAGKPAFPMRKKPEVHAWGKERNIWPDFYTDTSSEMWDNMLNGPFKMGRMPGGWRAPSLSTPDPITIGDAVTNQMPPMAEEVGNMMNISD